MNRRSLIITISIGLMIILGAVLIWFFFFRASANPTITPIPGGSPFGQAGPDIPFGLEGTEPAGTGLDQNGRPKEKLFRLVDTPVAGAVAFLKNGSTAIRYVDRATGHIYDVNPVTLEKTKITNNTLPKVYEAYFKNNASSVIFRTLADDGDTIINTSYDLVPPIASSTDNLYTMKASLLRSDISEIAVTPENSLVYTIKNEGTAVRSNFDGSGSVNLLNSEFSGWRLSAPNASNVFVYTKPSAGLPGYAYKVTGGNLSKILGPLDSLTVNASSDGKRVLYSYTAGGRYVLQSANISTGKTFELFPVTLSEKCVWSSKSTDILFCGMPSGGVGLSEPDSWYQGTTHFSDRLWKFNADIGLADILSEPQKNYGINIDAENLRLSPDEDYLIFQNKNDLTLWALRLQ